MCEISGFDLADSANWLRLKNLTATLATDPPDTPEVTENGAALALGTCAGEQMTDASTGGTTFALDADRAYVVWESTLAENALAPAQPTIVTVPFPGNGAAGSAGLELRTAHLPEEHAAWLWRDEGWRDRWR